jgi:hypothetical protein
MEFGGPARTGEHWTKGNNPIENRPIKNKPEEYIKHSNRMRISFIAEFR